MKKLLLALLLFSTPLAAAAERATSLPPPAYDPAPAAPGARKLVVAGGCFWGVQGVFQHVAGVSRAVSGYAGGDRETANYGRVSRGDTDHAESVEITYDPAKISLGELLRVFFSVVHDPTQVNRQGPDEGRQYRSAIFVADAEQENVARAYLGQLAEAKSFTAPIVTRIEPLTRFFPAEPYHQDYLIAHPRAPYVVINDLPKIENLRALYPALYREAPVATK